MDGNVHDTPPILPVPKPDDRDRVTQLEQELPAAKAAVEARKAAARPEFDGWIGAATAESASRLLPQDTRLLEMPLLEGLGNLTRVRLMGEDADLPLATPTAWQTGPGGVPALLLDGRVAELPTVGDFEHDQPFSATFWIKPPANDSFYAVLARMDESAAHRGWDMAVTGRRVAMHLIHSYPDDCLKVVAKEQLKADEWTCVAITYDGYGTTNGIKVYYDGKKQELNVENKDFKKG
jgi:hypothetical protein